MKNSKLNTKYNHLLTETELIDKMFDVQQKLNIEALQSKNPFSILLPPPNVTGKLHIGHAWNLTIQDCLIRYNILQGKKSYWICGMDHAGIATQTKYENSLREKNQYNPDEDRNTKIKKLYDWTQTNANHIRNQWKKMGLCLDYDNEWFTLQEKSNKVVNETFVRLYNDKLIYRAKKLVNWDTQLKTAISNIEVIKKDTQSKMYTIKYYIENTNKFLSVATTRPETIFVDECLVVNPEDERYKDIIGKKVFNPLTSKTIPIIADEYVDKSFGTGVMKCTPAHDFNDYELGIKYNLNVVSCFNEDGTTNEHAKGFENLTIKECRNKVVKYFKEHDLLIKEEDVISNIGFSERTGTVVEPMMSYQWFVSMKEYADKIIENQKTSNKVTFYPSKFEKMLINWLKNINDWCISRQLWWGHQIPVWYKNNSDEIYVGLTPPQNEKEYTRDNDVLDTWFSSGLWPITTSNALNEKHPNCFPTDVLVTAFDIIFFWVSRMIFFSLYLKNEIPFKNVYITGLIRDSLNRKMSKSLGNGIDPNDVVEQYGADSLRLFLLSSSSPGEDLSYSEQKVKSAWSFINKIWNSFRFLEMNEEGFVFDVNKKPNNFSLFDKWILNEFTLMVDSYKKQFSKYNFLVGIKKLVDFTWDSLCNTYIEFNKYRKEDKQTYLWVLNYLLINVLILLHPICPFVTNNLYESKEFKNKKSSILLETSEFEKWNFKDVDNIKNVLLIINKIRTFNFDNKITKNQIVDILVLNQDKQLYKFDSEIIKILNQAKINVIENTNIDSKPDFIESDFLIYITNKDNLLSSNNSLDKEKIMDEIKKLEAEIARCDGMLNNERFMSKAPESKIKEEKEKREKYSIKLEATKKLLK